MPQTTSNAIAIGTQAADFRLPGSDGKIHQRADFDNAKALLVAFISNRCPFVLLVRDAFAGLARDYEPRGLKVVAINSNDAQAHPQESLATMAEQARAVDYGFPYLKDATQDVAKTYGAACTPDFFLFDADRRLAYHGQFDDARPGNGKPVTGADLRGAIEAVLAAGQPPGDQIPSIGCNIKWTPGNEPSWFSTAA